MDILDIGGGFAMNSARFQNNFSQVAPKIRNLLKTTFPDSKYSGMRFIGEPGRFICQEAMTLVT